MKLEFIIYFSKLYKKPSDDILKFTHGYCESHNSPIEGDKFVIDIDPNNFLNLTNEDTKKEFIRIIEEKSQEYIKEKYVVRVDYGHICQAYNEKFYPEYNKLVLNEKSHTVYLLNYSERGDSDWYGDFNYLPNPLSKYVACTKQCETYHLRGSGHGYGTAGYIVKTSKDFIELMGWEEDLKYEISREDYIKTKNNNACV